MPACPSRVGTHRSPRHRLAPFMTALLVGACSDGATGPDDDDTAPVPVASVSVTPASSRIVIGDSVALTATPLDAAGNPLGGRVVTWTSSDSTRASVTDGVVRGINVGEVVVRARAGGEVGSASVTVEAAPGLAAIKGDGQVGLAGYALADSLEVRLFASDGKPVAGTSVTWTASSGSVSASSATTDTQGYARVQWLVGPDTGTVVAKTPGGQTVSFTGRGRELVPCFLAPTQETERFSLGPTDYTLSLDAAKPVNIVVLFVDFDDAPATEDPDALLAGIVEPGLDLLQELSYGRLNVTISPVKHWYRMSKSIGSYTWRTYQGHRTYLSEAMALADPDVDFSSYNAVYVFAPPSSQQPISPTFNGGQSGGVTFDGKTFGNGVTFGRDSRQYGSAILAHETGHMFGLVDLYAFDPAGDEPFRGNQFRFTGSWTLMADIFRPGHYTAWEKRKLGWLEPSEHVCLRAGEGVEVVLDPVETPGGMKMVGMPTGGSSAVVAEVRRLVGLDRHLCAEGVLLYDVDAAISSGQGPLRIRGPRVAEGACGPWSEATFGLGSGQESQLILPDTLAMRILGVDENGRYRVRLKR